MKVKPMIFNTEMVRALLDGRKLQTRRPVKPQPAPEKKWRGWVIESSDRKKEGCASWADGEGCRMFGSEYAKPPCKPGDLIYVRETFYQRGRYSMPMWSDAEPEDAVFCGEKIVKFIGDDLPDNGRRAWEKIWRKRPSIHMPRWASRLTLKVTGVRVDRVQDISETDAVKEGFDGWDDDVTGGCTAFGEFSQTWCGIYGEESWNRNDWVWVIDFEVICQNVDDYIRSLETDA